MQDKPKTLLEILKAAEKVLRDKDIESPRLNAELLLADILKVKRIALYLDFERPLSENEIDEYRNRIRRRLKREPLQYILGHTEFFGLNFKVNSSVLIPRQETEILAEQAIEEIKEKNLSNMLEIGTGSGCISIAVSKETGCKIKAFDSSMDALTIAKENSKINKTSDISFEECDILKYFGSFNEYDIVVSNPPYIPSAEVSNLQPEVRDYEPLNAFTDHEDGLKFYKRIIDISKKSREGIIYLLEIGGGRKKYIDELLKDMAITDHNYYKDLGGTERVLRFTISSQ